MAAVLQNGDQVTVMYRQVVARTVRGKAVACNDSAFRLEDDLGRVHIVPWHSVLRIEVVSALFAEIPQPRSVLEHFID